MRTVMVKICGLMREEDVVFCQEAGVDILGFVTEYPLPVPWNLTRQETAALLARVSLPHKSCIVTGGSPEKNSGAGQGTEAGSDSAPLPGNARRYQTDPAGP